MLLPSEGALSSSERRNVAARHRKLGSEQTGGGGEAAECLSQLDLNAPHPHPIGSYVSILGPQMVILLLGGGSGASLEEEGGWSDFEVLWPPFLSLCFVATDAL